MVFIGIFLLVTFGVGLIGWFLFKMNSHEDHANYMEHYSTSPIQFKTDLEEPISISEVEEEDSPIVEEAALELEEAPSPTAKSKESETMWGKALSDASDVLGQLDGIEKPAIRKEKAKQKTKRKTKSKTVVAKKKATPKKKVSTKKRVVAKRKSKKKATAKKPVAKKKSPTKKKAVVKKKTTAKPKAKKK